MIRAILLSGDGVFTAGGQELVERWRGDSGGRLWLDIEGEPGERERELLLSLGCDELAIGDTFRTRHPPKIEHFAEHTFILFRGIAQLDEQLELAAQQIGIWVGAESMITVHRGTSVSIDHAWQRSVSESRLDAPSGLALRLLHFACGRYLECLLGFEGRLGDLEDGMRGEQSEAEMKELVLYRSRLRKLRRIFNYHQRIGEEIREKGSPFLGMGDDDTVHLRRDVYDRCERLYSLCAMYYEICGDLVEGYISLSSHRLNNTMKVLTIITAVFVPLSFMAGLYGMNFENMPELQWKYAYFVLLGAMATLAIAMLAIFRHIRWL